MSLTDYVKDEVNRAGLLDEDSDYAGGIGRSLIELAKAWDKIDDEEGFSGMGASMVSALFYRLSRFKTINPISSEPSDWIDRSEESGKPMWQNKRMSSVFSLDAGKTW